jgi:enterochelin esterase-like enzyme
VRTSDPEPRRFIPHRIVWIARVCGAATIPGMDVRPDRPRPGPSVGPAGQEVTFRLDADPRWTPVRVWYHLRDHGADPAFRIEDGQWVARIPRPPVDRLEYLLVLRWEDGGEAMVPDPTNPRRVRGVFGDKSVIEFPGYAPPWWVTTADAADSQALRDAQARAAAAARGAALGRDVGHRRGPRRREVGAGLVPIDLPAGLDPGPARASAEGIASVRLTPRHRGGDDRIRRSPAAANHPASSLVANAAPVPAEVVDEAAEVAVAGRLHVPADSTPDEALPLLVVHDGPEYAEYCDLVRYLAVLVRVDPRLRCRALLLAPRDRDRSYSASPAYARALALGMLPQVTGSVATRGPVVGVGSSLGGLAMLHAAVLHPGSIGAVFSQSGSFFRPRTDGMERGYRYYGRIVRFIDAVDADPSRLAALQVTMTCGTGEENLANNRALARRLARAGAPVELVENPDGHNHVGWRDSLDPALRGLLTRVWAQPS